MVEVQGGSQLACRPFSDGRGEKLKSKSVIFLFILSVQALAWGQTDTGTAKPAAKPASPTAQGKTQTKQSAAAGRRKFVMDVVQSAVALPQPDPQDRLRVLNSAINVVSPIDHKLALQYAKEGVRIEAELIRSGQTPAVSIMATGDVDCASAVEFAQTVPATAVVQAEQSLIGAITSCRQALVPAQQKLETALNQGIVAPRGLLAAMEKLGVTTAWSQSTFEKMFSSLPSDAVANKAEAPNYAAMYDRMAPELDKDIAKSSGLKLLDWLSKVPESGERMVAINISTDAMKKALGDKAYGEALSSDVVAQQTAGLAGGEGEVEHPQEETVSILEAMNNSSADQTDALRQMPPSLRARQAAADGFASGSDGHAKMADRYFDIAYSALEDVWSHRADSGMDAPAVVEEVNEAAAQVNPLTALQRAQKLSDPSAQAISMLAVARTVVGKQ